MIVVLSTIATIFFYFNSKLNKIEYSNLTKSDLDIDTNIDNELSDYRNIAILGIDARSDTFSPGNRSDCIMIVSINKKTNEVKIASVYRDMYLDIDNRGLDKVTHAYSYGEAPLAINTLNTNLDLNIKEFVTVNFEAVAEAVALAAAKEAGFAFTVSKTTLYSYIEKGIFLNLTLDKLPRHGKKKQKYQKLLQKVLLYLKNIRMLKDHMEV